MVCNRQQAKYSFKSMIIYRGYCLIHIFSITEANFEYVVNIIVFDQ